MTRKSIEGSENLIVSLSGVSKVYGVPLFDPVSFILRPGEGLAVFGHNGCGKTTLLDMVAQIRKPDSGRIELAANVGYVMQTDGFQETLTCRDNLMIEAALCGLRGKELSARVQLCADKCGVTQFWGKCLSRCSAGMRTCLSVAAALISSPGLLLLDEVFASLDQWTRPIIRDLLMAKKESGTALLFVSHDKDDFSGLCEQVLTLPDAKVAAL